MFICVQILLVEIHRSHSQNILLKNRIGGGAGEMTYQIKSLANLDDPSSVPMTHTVEGVVL